MRLICGEYLNNPASITTYDYPQYATTATTIADALSSNTQSVSVLNAPSVSRTETSGASNRRAIGLAANGIGEYRNETLISNPKDTSYLTNLIQTLFFLRGIDVVSPQFADVDVFINVDVFGIIRSRTEFHLYNAEILRAQTKLEYFAVDRKNKNLLIKPKVNAYEAKYQERYALWVGPYQVNKTIQETDALLVDFSDIQPYSGSLNKLMEPEWSEEQEISLLPSNEVIRKRQEQ